MTEDISVRRRLVIGAGWMVSLRVADRVIGFFSMAILARLLLPEQFGTFNMAALVIGLLELFSELNVEAVLISDPDATREHFDTAWTLNVIRGFVLAAAIFLIAEPAASLLNEPAVVPVVRWLALTPILSSCQNIGFVYFMKELNFNREFVFMLTARTCATLVTILAAWLWRSYWALVVGMITRSGVRLILSYTMHGFRPRLSLRKLRQILHFSKWMFTQFLTTGLSERVPRLAVARTSGAEVLAFFDVSHETAHLATSEIRVPIRFDFFSVLTGWARFRFCKRWRFSASLRL